MPGTALEMYQKGRVYHARKDYTKAIQAFQEAIKAKPDFAEAYDGTGMSYGAMKRTDLAVDTHRAVRQPNARIAMITCRRYFLSGNKDLAWQEYRTLTSLNPNLAEKLKQTLQR